MEPAYLNRPLPLAREEHEAWEPRLATATTTLAATFHALLRLEPLATFAYQPHILRCRVHSPDAEVPPTLIIKQAKNRGGQKYHADDASFWSLAYRLFNDWAGVQFLQMVVPEQGFGPVLYAGNRDEGFIVLEDLGDRTSVKEALLDDDPQRAEAELVAVAARLGQLHGATIGERALFEQVRDALGPRDPLMYPKYAGYLRNSREALEALLEEVGVLTDERFSAELTALEQQLAEPGAFAAYTHGDPCPVNWLRPATELQLIDFEFGSYEHALIDAVHGRMLFPTYGFAQGILRQVIDRMEHDYRTEFARGCPAALEDQEYTRAMADACAYWTVFCLIRDLKPALVQEDETARTRGQLLVTRLRAFDETADEVGAYSALRRAAHALIERLGQQWGRNIDELRLYPAFEKHSQT